MNALKVEMFEGLCTTRAIRRYLPDPIPAEHLAKILFAATRAPSGANRQPVRFVVLRGGDAGRPAREVLGRAFRVAWAAKRNSDSFYRSDGSDPDSPRTRQARTIQHYVDHLEDVPVIVLLCARLRDGTMSFLDGASVYPAGQNLLLAARALGYGGVFSVWHLLAVDELKAAAGIPDDVTVAGVVTLGKPAGRHGPVRRVALADVVYDETWEQPAEWAADPPGTRLTRPGPAAPVRPRPPSGGAE
ncbi:nitroreductase family protein [Jiangella ureilytica]|uniref:nitroreductase family protein n=1 Tax=Jiangella ureilytica TaxID=2530374 RepID=UPI0013A5CA77|nr:nitroreductase family protein [Jiangella ureilytica]